ncbi:MAG: hypothetical protein GX100_11285 [candidate division WS1 bacterium]|nr:hypothetical protein [candidate division WS1 bacterium]
MVREIYRLFVDERLSLNAIIVELEARGIRSQSGRERWSRSLVHSIVSRETYTGTAYMFKHYATEPQRGRERGDYRRVRNSSRRQRQREDWIPVRVPAIIPREVWERAGERLAQNQRLALRNTRRQYLLRGLVRCAACGQSWRGQFNTGYLYYCCGGKRRDGRPKGERCRAKAVRVDRLEPVVWDTVRGLLESPELLVAEYRKEFAHRQAAAETVGKQRRKPSAGSRAWPTRRCAWCGCTGRERSAAESWKGSWRRYSVGVPSWKRNWLNCGGLILVPVRRR